MNCIVNPFADRLVGYADLRLTLSTVDSGDRTCFADRKKYIRNNYIYITNIWFSSTCRDARRASQQGRSNPERCISAYRMGTDSAWIVTAQGGITCFVKKDTAENPMAVWGVRRGDTRRASLHAYEPCT